MGSSHDYNDDGYTSGVEAITKQGGWQINFQHIPSGHGVFFEAFITNFEDSFTSTWSEEDVYGRMDPIATYQNTKRAITFSFDVIAESQRQAIKNTHRFQHLSSFLYPAYETDQYGVKTMTAPPLIKIKFVNLIQNAAVAGEKTTTDPLHSGLIGYVDGFSYAPKLDTGFVPETVGGNTTGNFHPLIYSVSVNFKVLHSHDLGWDASTKKWLAGGKGFPNSSGAGPGINANVEGEKYVLPGPRTKSKTDTAATAQPTPGKTETKVDRVANKKALVPSMTINTSGRLSQ